LNIDTEHLHHWMQAIRQSPDPLRTMDAFWSGQIKSKEWLIDSLEQHVKMPVSIDIHAGWVGVLASMLFQSKISITGIRSIDIDPVCAPIAINMNKIEEMQGRFKAITGNMCKQYSNADIIINTSCEHITQEQYLEWLDNMPSNTILVLQSNNYDIPEHVRIANSLNEFQKQSNLNELWAGELVLPMYTRYMIIGTRYV
jgi:hypothetical protein